MAGVAMDYEWYEYQHSIMLTSRLTLKVGSWDVGYVEKDWTTHAPRGCTQVAYTLLPGLPQVQGHYGTVREAKEAVETAATWWFYHLENREEPKQEVKRISRTRPQPESVRVRRTRAVQEEPVSRVRRAPRAQ